MTRISWIRTTPEGWEEAIKRMVRLHGVTLEPDDARKILRYLSDEHGLAPEEARPVEYFPEHRMIDEKVPSEDITRSCVACHALAKPLSWRRSPEDWKMLANTHLALYPWTDGLNFQRPPRRPGEPPPPPGTDMRPPVEQALAFLEQSGSLHSPEWAEWHATMRSPRLAGRWLVSGTQPGKGKFFGAMDVEAAHRQLHHKNEADVPRRRLRRYRNRQIDRLHRIRVARPIHQRQKRRRARTILAPCAKS